MKDKDGFYVLKRIESVKKEIVPYVGANRILDGPGKIDPVTTNTGVYRFKVTSNAVHIEYQPKTWQYKAWSILSKGLDLSKKSQFGRCKYGNRKFHHILRIGLALKVRSDDRNGEHQIFDQLSTFKNPYGMYNVADTPAEFVLLMDRWYAMVYDNIEAYLDMARKEKVESIVYVPKIFIIYDDMTFDTQTGDPRYLYEMLGLKTDKKGHVIL